MEQLPSSSTSCVSEDVSAFPKTNNNGCDQRLANMDVLKVPERDRAWFERLNIAVRDYMYGVRYDTSHDYEHSQRVVVLAYQILNQEKHHSWAKSIDPLEVYVAALTHNIGDTRHVLDTADDSNDDETDEVKQERQRSMIRAFLDDLKVPPIIAAGASEVASYVSFAREVKNKEHVKDMSDTWPAIKVVQDADRLDGLGAVGVSRLLVYYRMDATRLGKTIRMAIQVVEDRFKEYTPLMKTNTGKRIAEARWRWMSKEFLPSFHRQTDVELVFGEGGVQQALP